MIAQDEGGRVVEIFEEVIRRNGDIEASWYKSEELRLDAVQ